MRYVAAALTCIALWAPSLVHADVCASYGPEPFLSIPRPGQKVARNATFEIDLSPRCGGITGPTHRFRLRTKSGKAIAAELRTLDVDRTCHPTACKRLLLDAEGELPAGEIRLEVRAPEDAQTLGDWTTLAELTVADRVDQDTPDLDGPLMVNSEPVRGTVSAGPHPATGWVLETTFVFSAARDSAEPDELLYAIEYLDADGGNQQWKTLRTFRPEPRSDGQVQTTHRHRAFDRERRYRVRVRDAARHESTGSATRVSHPEQPDDTDDTDERRRR